jgi:hypothetical protein
MPREGCIANRKQTDDHTNQPLHFFLLSGVFRDVCEIFVRTAQLARYCKRQCQPEALYSLLFFLSSTYGSGGFNRIFILYDRAMAKLQSPFRLVSCVDFGIDTPRQIKYVPRQKYVSKLKVGIYGEKNNNQRTGRAL